MSAQKVEEEIFDREGFERLQRQAQEYESKVRERLSKYKINDGVVDSNYPFHNMYISGSVTNIGKAIAFNAGLHVVAYDNSALEVDMTVPLGDGLAFGTDSATNAFLANNLTYGISSLKLSSLDNGQTMTINISIYHEGNVSNWTITPVWTNSP